MPDIDRILAPHRHGLPAVVLHCGEHCYRSHEFPNVTPWFEFTGLQSTRHDQQQPIEVSFIVPDSPITKGMANWTTIKEELYNNSAGHLLDTATPLARGQQTVKHKGKETHFDFVVVWTNNYRNGTKVFATTLGHNDQTVSDPPLSGPGDARTALVVRQVERRLFEARRAEIAGPSPAHTLISNPFRRSRDWNVLASGSPTISSAAGSQWIVRPSRMAIFARWHVVIARWCV